MTTDQPCVWQRTEYGYDAGACGLDWHLEDGTPPEHGMNFCPGCGKRLEWHEFVDMCEHDIPFADCKECNP